MEAITLPVDPIDGRNMDVTKSPFESLPRSACAEIVKKFSVWLTAYLPRLPKVRAEMVKAATVLSSRRCSFVRVGAGMSEGGEMPF